MFERYTERARRVLFFARYEASQLGSISIETEHLLLGLIREGKGLTSRIFARSHLTLKNIREETEGRTVFFEKVSTSVEIPFSTETKRVLQFTAEEADRMLCTYIGTEHLLLGILREERSVAASILMKKGMRLHTVREDIVHLLNEKTTSTLIQPVVIQVLQNITPELLKALKADPMEVRHLTPEQFEHLVAERMDRMGFAVSFSGPTNRKDGGVDIIAARRDPAMGNFLVAAQVKHHKGARATGREPVDRMLRLKNTVFKFGLVVTNTNFTADAKWVAEQDDNRWFVRLRDFEAIKSWLHERFTYSDTDLPEFVELAPGVRIKVPRPPLG